MALARFVEGDVYVYYKAMGGIACLCCKLIPLTEVDHREGGPFAFLRRTDFATQSRTEMLKHLKKHKDSGDTVPARAFDQLEEDLRRYGDDANVFD